MSWEALVHAFNAGWLQETGEHPWLVEIWRVTGPLAAAVFLGGPATETLLVMEGLCRAMELDAPAEAARLYAQLQASRDLCGLLLPLAALESEVGERRVALQVLWCGQHKNTPAGHEEAATFIGEALCGIVRMAFKKGHDLAQARAVRGRFVYALARALESHPRAPHVSPLDCLWPLLEVTDAGLTREELCELDDAERGRLFDSVIGAFAAEGGVKLGVSGLGGVARGLRARIRGVSS